MTSNPYTAEAKILAILDEMEFKITGTPKHWEKTPERIAIENETVQQLKGLLVDARLDELKHVYGPDGDDYMWTDIDEDDVNQKVLDRMAALQQTRQEEVRE